MSGARGRQTFLAPCDKACLMLWLILSPRSGIFNCAWNSRSCTRPFLCEETYWERRSRQQFQALRTKTDCNRLPAITVWVPIGTLVFCMILESQQSRISTWPYDRPCPKDWAIAALLAPHDLASRLLCSSIQPGCHCSGFYWCRRITLQAQFALHLLSNESHHFP